MTGSAPGFGSLYSPVAIVGEALCRKCVEAREPFVRWQQRASSRDAFKRAGVAKAELFITNSIHCHPPGDGDPYPHETWNCSGFLRAELREIVQPRLVIGVGRVRQGGGAVAVRKRCPRVELALPGSSGPDCQIRPILTYLHIPEAPLLDHDPARSADREQYIRRLGRAIEWGTAPPHHTQANQ